MGQPAKNTNAEFSKMRTYSVHQTGTIRQMGTKLKPKKKYEGTTRFKNGPRR